MVEEDNQSLHNENIRVRTLIDHMNPTITTTIIVVIIIIKKKKKLMRTLSCKINVRIKQ